jgi:hypothetical protein
MSHGFAKNHVVLSAGTKANKTPPPRVNLKCTRVTVKPCGVSHGFGSRHDPNYADRKWYASFKKVKFIISEMFTLLPSNFSFVDSHFSFCSKFVKENFEALFKVSLTCMVVYSM